MITDAERKLQERYKQRRLQKERQAAQAAASSAKEPAQAAAPAAVAPATAPNIELAKAALAKQQASKPAAQARPAKLASKQPPASAATPAPHVDPLEAAKRALAAQQAKPAASTRRPVLKRPVPRAAPRHEDEPAAKRPYSPTQALPQPSVPQPNGHSGPQDDRDPAASAAASAGLEPEPAGSSATQARVHVGGLPAWATDADLLESMAPYGALASGHVIPGAGYGFVTFRSPADAARALDLPPHHHPSLNGSTLTVRSAFHSKEHSASSARPWRPPHESNHPKVQAACAAAEALAEQPPAYSASLMPPERDLVSYDDL